MKLKILFTIILFTFASLGSADELRKAVDSEDRSEKNIVRDEFRKPYETLSFFQLEPDMTIVELSPGGGWYTEILANFIRKSGNLIAAHFSKDSDRAYFRNSRINFEKKVKENNLYEKVTVVDLNSELSDPSSVDAVLTHF